MARFLRYIFIPFSLFLISGCGAAVVTETPLGRYTIDLENKSDSNVTFKAEFYASLFLMDTEEEGKQAYGDSGFVSLSPGETKSFTMLGHYPAKYAKLNYFLRYLAFIAFYTKNQELIREWKYDREWKDDHFSQPDYRGNLTEYTDPDDTQFFYKDDDLEASWEQLFVESSTRPFYLERDDKDASLGRLIISDTPQP